ncbi:MerR family transcriptional regulator [Eubacteriales bacterium OttesenSCG-928-N13]|nr:MerR family transcriptional regulator [Eubacteriales bacterium OttesenSCG-928-N13]
MFKIGEFSRLVRVSPRMLRHYEKCGLLYPAEIDRFTGYRSYSAQQIPLLMNIVMLRDMGFSIDETADILPHLGDAAYMDNIVRTKSASVQANIEVEQLKLQKLQRLMDRFGEERNYMVYDVELKDLPSAKVLSLRAIIPAYNEEGELWHKLMKYVGRNGIQPVGGGYSIYHDAEYREADVDVEVAVPVDKLGESRGEFIFKELEAMPSAATIRFAGTYDGGYQAASEKLGEWMERNGYEFAGLLRGYAITSPSDTNDPQNYVTELQVPVRKR